MTALRRREKQQQLQNERVKAHEGILKLHSVFIDKSWIPLPDEVTDRIGAHVRVELDVYQQIELSEQGGWPRVFQALSLGTLQNVTLELEMIFTDVVRATTVLQVLSCARYVRAGV